MRLIFSMLSFALMTGVAAAATPAGRVLDIDGSSRIGELSARAGEFISAGSTLVTDAEASMSLRMLDDSIVLLGPGSRLVVERYRFDPETVAKSEAHYRLEAGSVRLISGVMSKLKPGSVSLATPQGEITTLGTDYSAGLCASDCSETPGLYVSVRTGQVRVSGTGGARVLGGGQVARFDGSASAPNYLARSPAFMLGLGTDVLIARFDTREPETLRLRVDAQDFLNGVLDPAASPSLPVASAGR